jgi:choloylglycine hydrolase
MLRARHGLLLLLLLLVASCGTEDRYLEVVDVAPMVDAVLGDPGDPVDWESLLDTYRNHGPLHVMTFAGDFSALMQLYHGQILQYYADPAHAGGTHTNCSMFRYASGDTSVVGRNFDNVDTELLAAWFYPADGHPSITFVPLMELGFNPESPFDPDDAGHRRRLTTAPVVSIGGMNARGVTVTLASLDRRAVAQHDDREPKHFLHLVREILDQAADLDEALAIAYRYDVFDNGLEVISHHVFVTDPDGSAVLEWHDGVMQVVREEGPAQVVTNSDLLDVPERARRNMCPRYRTLARRLGAWEDTPGWRTAMDALAAAAQENRRYVLEGEERRISTQWSAVFVPESREIYLCLHRDWSTVYRLRFPGLNGGG